MPDVPFPTNEGDIELFIENLAEKAPAVQVVLGLSAGDMVRLAAAAANFDYMRNMTNQVNDSKEAFTSFKNDLFYGPTEGNLAVPTFPAITLPELGEPGIVPWVKSLIKRIKASPGYTDQIGIDLGLFTDTVPESDPSAIVPTLALKALNDGNVEIKFSKQGLDAMRVDWRKKGEAAWNLAGVYTTSPGIHNQPSTGNEPEGREYRGILLKKNEPVSQYSATYNIVTTP
jgi:hypothetical protein